VKTDVEIFNKQQTKLKEVQFIDSGTQLDSTSGRTFAVTSVAIANAIVTAIVIAQFVAVN
jgi:hypothetical protein